MLPDTSFLAMALVEHARFWAVECRVDVDPRPELARMIFYMSNYEVVASFEAGVGRKQRLSSSTPGTCRFCRLSHPAVTFETEAHALQEALGNKSLSSDYECDDCNALFGGGIETDLGNWTLPSRWLAQIRGKRGLPTIRESSKGGWRFEFEDGSPVVRQSVGHEVFAVDEAARTARIRLRRDPFVPVAVAKALVKIALTVMPEDRLSDFADALDWIREARHQPLVRPLELRKTFVPGPRPFEPITIKVLMRRRDDPRMPYAILILAFGNEQLEIAVPCPARDAPKASIRDVPAWPTDFERGRGLFGLPLQTGLCDLSDTDRVKGETVTVTLSYDEATHLDAAAARERLRK